MILCDHVHLSNQNGLRSEGARKTESFDNRVINTGHVFTCANKCAIVVCCCILARILTILCSYLKVTVSMNAEHIVRSQTFYFLILKPTAGYTIYLYLVLSRSPESNVTSKKTKLQRERALLFLCSTSRGWTQDDTSGVSWLNLISNNESSTMRMVRKQLCTHKIPTFASSSSHTLKIFVKRGRTMSISSSSSHCSTSCKQHVVVMETQQHMTFVTSAHYCVCFLPLTSCRRSRLLSASSSAVTVVTVSFGGRPRRPRRLTMPTVT